MRVQTLLVAMTVVLLVTACAQPDERSAEPSTTTTSQAVATTTTDPPTTTMPPQSTTTTTVGRPAAGWTVQALGRNPTRSLDASGAVGSGCSPGTDAFPDGVWFGWVSTFGPDRIEFDLACLWPGRLQPAVSNDAARLRTIPMAANALIYLEQTDPVSYTDWATQGTPAADAAPNAPGLPGTTPFWVFVNDALVTEVAQYLHPIRWSRAGSAWLERFHGPSTDGTVVPASPADPWPDEGWPVDGFYEASVDEETDAHYELTIRKFLSCRDDPNPGYCLEFWTGDEVYSDPDLPALQRILRFDEELTVVIMPIFDDTPMVGDGTAFTALLTDITSSMAAWGVDRDTVEVHGEVEGLSDRVSDPAFPFGIPAWPATVSPANPDILGYRGPGGTHLTVPGWFYVLEIKNGHPILYVQAGRIAG